MANYRHIDTEKARRFCERIFRSYGFTEEESQTITDVLIRADLYGIESHGMQRLIRYHNEIGSGYVDVRAKPEIVHETGISAVIDARKWAGQLAAVQGMKLAIAKARSAGCGMVSVRNSNHYGIAGYYSGMAVEADLLGICMTNSEAISVPTFGRQAMIGSNPIAVAMPADPVPFSYDAATTVVSRGKLEIYNKNGKALPDQWALGAGGNPSDNAAEVLHNIIHKLGGGIAPLGGAGELNGGHKGYGLGLVVEIFTAVFSGGLNSSHVSVTPGLNGICHYFMAVDYGLFGDKQAIKARLSAFLRELREGKKAEGQERVYTHGEKEAEMMAARLNGQIPVNEKTLEEMRAIAAGQKVDWEF
ncbi:MAG: Ldh family oxidoreductase [Treponema sp.]|jgi:LDH2 family malate/lactate/ureidoglycolate dehydrogenase|nr:Ldh family oxidoreductase [Treponema sp.]